MKYIVLLCLLTGSVLHNAGTEVEASIEIGGSELSAAVPESNDEGLQLQCLQACDKTAEFALYVPSQDVTHLGNCTVTYRELLDVPDFNPTIPTVYTRFFTTRRRYDTFHLQGLVSSKQYTVEVTCDRLKSSVLPFYVKAECDPMTPDIQVLFVDSCASIAILEWIIFQTNTSLTGLPSCCVRYYSQEQFFTSVSNVQLYKFLPNSGVFKLSGLKPGMKYFFNVSCGTARSNVSTFRTSDNKCTEDLSAVESEVPVVFKDDSSLFSSKDSILGIVFGLCGFLLIIVTTFYVLRKVRRRQRLQRIRRYLGSSLVDPFENLENRMPHEDSSSERLISMANV